MRILPQWIATTTWAWSGHYSHSNTTRLARFRVILATSSWITVHNFHLTTEQINVTFPALNAVCMFQIISHNTKTFRQASSITALANTPAITEASTSTDHSQQMQFSAAASHHLLISAPRLARLGVLLFFVVDSVCLSVCLSHCSFKSILIFLFLDGIEPFFGCHFSMCPSTKHCSSITNA